MNPLAPLRAAWRRRHTLAAGPTLLAVVALSVGGRWYALGAIAVALAVWLPLALRACVRYYRQEVRRHASH